MERVAIPASAGYPIPASFERRPLFMALGLTLAYVLLDWLTYVFPARFGITPLNPEAALAIAALMFCGMRFVPLVFLAVVTGEYFHPQNMRPLTLILINSAVLSAGYAAIAALLAGRFRISVELDTRRDVQRLVGVTLACMLLCGLLYVGVLVIFDVGPVDRYFRGVRRFFIGYSAGILVAAPLLIMLFSARRRQQFVVYLRSPEGWLQIVAIAACTGWVFLQDLQEHVRYFYMLFIPLIWAATRNGMVGAASALTLIQTGVFMAVYARNYQPLSVFELQLLLIALAITGLLLAVAIDEQRRLTRDIRESLKLAAAGEMAAAITHELNQPLTALSGYATAGQIIAASANPDRAQLNDTLQKLQEESRRTSAVVRRLRDFFRSGATRLEPVALDHLAQQVMQSLRGRADAKGVALALHANGTVRPLLVDPLQMEVVLRNLIMNAIESANSIAGNQGRVDVDIETLAAGELRVTVRDNGPGIPAGDTDRLFDSFVTTKAAGMGMGLAISRAIVNAHGGRIWAVPGASGLLCFALPADLPAGLSAEPARAFVRRRLMQDPITAASAAETVAAEAQRKKMTVYVIEDDAAIRDALALSLSLRGYHIAQFASAEDFLSAFDVTWSGCAVVDLRLPGLSGLQLQAAMAERGSKMPVVIITGHGDVSMARAAFRAKAIDFLEKPLEDAHLISAIETAFEHELGRINLEQGAKRHEAMWSALSPREREVMKYLMRGLHAREIGEQLGISHRTVEVHKAHIMEKMGVRSVIDVVRFGMRAPD